MRKQGLTDDALRRAVTEIAEGLVDADLGSYLVKKRVRLPGRGKRGGARTIVGTRMKSRWFFLYGFSKNERADIDKDELKALQELANEMLMLNERQIATSLSAGELMEVFNGNEES